MTGLTNAIPQRRRQIAASMDTGTHITYTIGLEDQLAAAMQENAELKAYPLKLICEKCNVLTDVNPNEATHD